MYVSRHVAWATFQAGQRAQIWIYPLVMHVVLYRHAPVHAQTLSALINSCTVSIMPCCSPSSCPLLSATHKDCVRLVNHARFAVLVMISATRATTLRIELEMAVPTIAQAMTRVVLAGAHFRDGGDARVIDVIFRVHIHKEFVW